MLHTVLIVLHAAAGVAAFVVGLFCLPLRVAGSWRFRIYVGSLVAMLVFVLGAIAVSWADLSLTSRLVFTGLTALGLYMLWRAGQAQARLQRQDQGWRAGYLDDVGFTVISLFAGFVIVAAIDLRLPGWLVALIAVGGVAAGVYTMKQVKAGLVTGQQDSQTARARGGARQPESTRR